MTIRYATQYATHDPAQVPPIPHNPQRKKRKRDKEEKTQRPHPKIPGPGRVSQNSTELLYAPSDLEGEGEEVEEK